jgi:hypothetical protein
VIIEKSIKQSCFRVFIFPIFYFYCQTLLFTMWIFFTESWMKLNFNLYINSHSLSVRQSVVEVLKPISLLIKLSPWTRGPKNYSRLLRPFLRSNCRRQWGRYFCDLEGGWGDLGALFLG